MAEVKYEGNILEVRDLKTYFYTEAGVVKAVDGVDLQLKQGETLGIVGESGSGKSVMSLSIMRLVASPPGRTVRGRVLFEGRDLMPTTDVRALFRATLTDHLGLPETDVARRVFPDGQAATPLRDLFRA